MVRPTLNDNANTWQRVPYQVTWGGLFADLRSTLTYRSIDQYGITTADRIKGYYSMGENVMNGLGINNSSAEREIVSHPYFRDTRVGGNDAINCTWQFCQDDDICYPVLATESHPDTPDYGPYNGLGRVYATTTEHNAQICWFTFGVPYYTPLADFYKNSFNQDLIELNNAGQTSISIGKVFKSAVSISIKLLIFPIKLFGYLSKNLRSTYPVNRFYELRACMPLYYQYVDSILAEWLVSVGLYSNGNPSKYGSGKYSRWDRNKDQKDRSEWENWIGGLSGGRNSWVADAEFVPDALRATGASIWDIIRRRAMVAYGQPFEDDSASSYASFSELYESYMDEYFKVDDDGNPVKATNKVDWKQKLSKYVNAADSSNISYASSVEYHTNSDQSANDPGGRPRTNPFANDGGNGTWSDAFKASALGATQFIGFKINKDTDASESFSNSTSPSNFAESYNSKVREAAAKKNDIAMGGNNDANFGLGWVDNVMNGVVGAIQGVIQGLQDVSDGVLDLCSAVITGAYIDIPEMYSGSSFGGGSHSITFQLRSPYGDYISIYQSIIVPLALLLAGSLPRAGGPDSYMQPFLCRCYCKGMFSVPMGIIESLSIKRGSSEFGWTYNNLPTCVDVSLTIKDMSPIMYLTLNNSYFEGLFVQDNSFKQYIATLSGLGLFERISAFSRIKRNVQFTMHKLRNELFSSSYWSNEVATFAPVRVVSAIIPKQMYGER